MKKILKKLNEVEILAPVGSSEYGKRVREIYKNTISEPVILSETLYDSLCRYDEIVSSINNLKNEKNVIEHTIMGLMKQNDTAYIKERIITWKKSSRTTLDSNLLKEEEPEIYKKYCKISSNRVFKIK